MPDDLLLVALFAALKLVGLGLGAALLLPILRDERVDGRALRGEDEGGGGGSDRIGPVAPRGPRPDGCPAPLPDAAPARVRLRDGRRLADLLPRRERRPQHAPEPGRSPVRDQR
ncbi:MAG TPA: hypothetical protein VK506_09500 [Conexibacter sp.]|nr:hypothetical protein [Conexibacter sp.]